MVSPSQHVRIPFCKRRGFWGHNGFCFFVFSSPILWWTPKAVNTLQVSIFWGNDVAAPLLEKYLKGKKGVTVENRRRILRLIENMTMGRKLGHTLNRFRGLTFYRNLIKAYIKWRKMSPLCALHPGCYGHQKYNEVTPLYDWPNKSHHKDNKIQPEMHPMHFLLLDLSFTPVAIHWKCLKDGAKTWLEVGYDFSVPVVRNAVGYLSFLTLFGHQTGQYSLPLDGLAVVWIRILLFSTQASLKLVSATFLLPVCELITRKTAVAINFPSPLPFAPF